MDIPRQKELEAPGQGLPPRLIGIENGRPRGAYNACSRSTWARVRAVPSVATTFVDPRTPQGDQVEIPLDQDGEPLLADRLARPGKPVEVVPLRVNRRLGRVHVFRLTRAHDPAAEGDDMAVDILDGDHQSPPEPVVMTL